MPAARGPVGRRAVFALVLLTVVGTVAHATAAPVPPSDESAARIRRQLDAMPPTSVTDIVPAPDVSARAWLVYDATAHEPVAATDPATARPIASLAKLMTALVVVDRLQLDDPVTIPRLVNQLPADASVMGARAGETWPAGDLLRAMLGYSANDAALALAAHVGDGSIDAFVQLMQERASDLGLADSTFASPTGLDTPGAANTSTPVDLAALAETALLDADIRAAVAAPDVKLVRPRSREAIVLPNRNPLLGKYAGVDGVKTGFTNAAGYMYVAHHVDPETETALIVVTASSTSEATRASDAAALLDWARSLRSTVTLAAGGTDLGSIPVQHSTRRVRVFVCDDLTASVRVGQRIDQEVVLPAVVKPPISQGDELGTLRIRAGSADAISVPVCSATGLQARGLLGRARLFVGDYRSAWRAGVDGVRDAWDSARGAS